MVKVRDKILKCLRCNHVWKRRTGDVRFCANKKCRSGYWDRARKKGFGDGLPIEGMALLKKNHFKKSEY